MPSSVESSKMFHTFQGLAPPRPTSEQSQDAPKPSTNGVSKRITTPHACAECKRRKIRCDGRQPCGQCLGCRSPKPCYYDKHRQRVIPSRKTLDALTQSLEECRSILKKLYPARDVQELLPLSRHDLLSLLDRADSQSNSSPSHPSPSGSNTSPLSQSFQSPMESATDDDQSLSTLEQIPSHDIEWDEERRNRYPIPAEADDVNALSLSVDRQSCYFGATSIKAAFLVMLKIAPGLRSFLAPPNNLVVKQQSGAFTTPRPGSMGLRPQPILWSSEGQTLIDAYFNRVQIIIPMLDEPSFRADYLSGRRSDSPWLALLNMVFAMGSIVATKSDDNNHGNYYGRAREHLGIDSFGSGHLEVLQAYALMGGFYLHYINRPNMANAITGAALRMACALGLHREGIDQTTGSHLMQEQRRRTWWSLFCLDTWASTTLGRPSMGRWGLGITIRAPEGTHDPNIIGQHTGIIPLIENIKFCKIATQIQDVLAQTPLLRHDDRAILDSQLVAWYEDLPWILQSTEPCPESLYTARCVMKWRYQNLRLVLYRPVLLNVANRGNQGHPPSQDELAAVATVRAIAKETIQDIAQEWTRNQMLGWNGVWFIYQAAMIPLVSLFWESWNGNLVRGCQLQLEVVLDALEGMSDWSLAARRSREVVSKMYEASKHSMSGHGSPKYGNNGIHGISGVTTVNVGHGVNLNGMPSHLQHMEGHEMHMDMLNEDGMVMVENPDIWDLDGMLWGNLPDGLDLPFDGVSSHMEFEDGGLSYDGNYLMNG